jgi:hypothetical protein
MAATVDLTPDAKQGLLEAALRERACGWSRSCSAETVARVAREQEGGQRSADHGKVRRN